MRSTCALLCLPTFPSTQKRTHVIQVHAPWYLSQEPHTLNDIYTSICMYEYAYRYLCINCTVYSHVLCLALVYFSKCIPLGPRTALIVWQGQQWPSVFSHSCMWCSSFIKQYTRERNAAMLFCLRVWKIPPLSAGAGVSCKPSSGKFRIACII